MNFIQKRKKGARSKVRKYWFDGAYRIVWRKEAFGIEMPARYQANVRLTLPSGSVMWDFVSTRRLFKTMKAATEACEKHQKLWEQASTASGIRKLEELFGKVPFGWPSGTKLNRNVYAILVEMSAKKRKNTCELDAECLQ
jgi:hypothetical protein